MRPDELPGLHGPSPGDPEDRVVHAALLVAGVLVVATAFGDCAHQGVAIVVGAALVLLALAGFLRRRR